MPDDRPPETPELLETPEASKTPKTSETPETPLTIELVKARHPWNPATTKAQEKALREALLTTSGNISHAAKIVGIDHSHATRLMKKYNLQEFARDLRKAAGFKGQMATGRPPGS